MLLEELHTIVSPILLCCHHQQALQSPRFACTTTAPRFSWSGWVRDYLRHKHSLHPKSTRCVWICIGQYATIFNHCEIQPLQHPQRQPACTKSQLSESPYIYQALSAIPGHQYQGPCTPAGGRRHPHSGIQSTALTTD